MATLREASKLDWNSNHPPSYKDIKIGSLQRIADAAELLARNWQQLIEEREMYKRWYREQQATTEHCNRRIAALRGVITKMKREAED